MAMSFSGSGRTGSRYGKWAARIFLLLSFSAISFLGIHDFPAPNVVTDLRFDEGTGLAASDGSGNGHTGTLVNGPTWSAGRYGQGLNFDGNNDYVGIADHANFTLDPTLSYTWSAWVRNNNFNQWSTVWSQTIDANNFFYYYAHSSNDGDAGPVTNGVSVYWWTNGGGNKLVVHSNNNVLTAGVWSHITITYDGSLLQASRFTIFVNGVDVTNRGDVSSAGTLATLNPTNTRIGANEPFGETINGSIDEVRYYRRLLSLAEIQADMNIGNDPDSQAPSIQITSPSAGNVSGTIDITANASDNVGVTGVQFQLDGTNLGAEDNAAPYSFSWNTTTVGNGSHSLTAIARDAAGNLGTSSTVLVNVNNLVDEESPVVNITSPAGGSSVSGAVNITASASDDIGVVGVQFLVDGNNHGSEDLVAPFTASWSTTSFSNGPHTLTARARDAVGNITISSPVQVTVANNNLVAAYGFNENSGTTANDNSGNGNHGTLVNGPVWSGAGRFGSAIQFDGTNDMINIADASSLDLTNGMTIEAWVNPSNLTGFKTVVCKDRGTSAFSYVLSANNNASNVNSQRPNSRIRLGSTNRSVAGTSKLPLNTWSHLASTFDGTTFRLYVNGILVRSSAFSGTITTSNNLLHIGGTTVFNQFFAGLIDEVRIYNIALTQPEIQSDMNTPIAPDVENPTITLSSPAAGEVSGNVNISANASDNLGVVGVQFLLDGANLGAEDLLAPYSYSWNTTSFANGSYTLSARARDAAGNTTSANDVVVTVNNDTEPPSVNITQPGAGTVSGTIDVTADANDNVGITGVQFLLDGVNLGGEDLVAPFAISWNTISIADGNHILTARARDAAGNVMTSGGITINVLNNPPDTESPLISLTAPSAGEVAGTIDITATASDNIGIIGVQFLLDGANLGAEDLAAPYSFSWNTTSLANGSYTLSARAWDAAGNTTIAGNIIVTINNDTELPNVVITQPLAGTVAGTIDISAEATDNIGIVGVQFLLDGVELGSEDLVAPYTITWNTSTIADGNHTLTARARDAAGNLRTSAVIAVNVLNNPPDTEFPLVSINTPVAGDVSGALNITANASDNVGVVGVQFLVNGIEHGVEDLTFPYSRAWNTEAIPNGSYTIAARARDAAGNITTSPDVVVNVNNIPDTEPPTINLTSPSTGNISGTVNVSANASDNKGITGVQFLLNGANLGVEDLVAPYTFSWNTVTVPNGPYTLSARARDAAGNTNTSAGINVNVSNATGLIAAYHLNEPSGTSATDISGNGHHGTLVNAPARIAGRYEQGIGLDGSNDYINIPDHNNFTLNPAQDYTWSAWVRNNNFNQWSTVWSQTIDANNFFYFYAHSSGDADAGPVTNGVSVYWWTNNGSNRLVAHSNNNVLTAGQWSHVAITYDASLTQSGRFTIYVNGVDVTNRGDISSSGTLATLNPTNIRIGANQPYGEYLNGAVDELRYYQRLLSQSEIVNDMNSSLGIDETAPLVTLTQPINGSSVYGKVNLTATASDNVGVAGVQFLVDGVNVGAELVAPPYTFEWNTETVANGTHTLSVRARDAAGNITTSAESIVTVAPNFTFTLLTPNRNVETTGQIDFRIYVSYHNGFTAPGGVALSVSGLPANTTNHFLFNPMSHQGETQLYVNTTNAVFGTYPITLSAVAEGITHTQDGILNITPTADFALTASPSIQNVSAGSATNFTINVNETNDYVSPVNLSVLDLPPGVTATFNPASPVPTATSSLTLTTSGAAPIGTYNLTVQGESDGLIRSIPITLTISSSASLWTVSSIGSTGVPNNTVRVGALQIDGQERVYVGTIATGRMLEYTWNGSDWAGPVDIGGSPGGIEIHDCNIGPGRGDGKDRLYAASYDFNIYEIWHDETGWHQITMGNVGNNLGMHMDIGDGRNDGVTRVYAASTQQLYEFTWNGTSWDRLLVGPTPGAHGVAIGNGRNDGTNRIYIASISSGNFEATWNGTSWSIVSMGDAGDARGIGLGVGRNDGIIRVYSAIYDGTMREFTWNGSGWSIVNMASTGIQNVHAYVIPGRNDGVNRLYTDNGNGKVWEYSWNGTSWTTYNLGGGSDYMYGLHWGRGRNDGLIRLYSADRGSVNRVYEFTWTTPPPISFLRKYKPAFSIWENAD